MNRFSILPGNKCAVFDRAEGCTFQLPNAVDAEKMCALLQGFQDRLEECDSHKVAALRNALEDLVDAKNYKDNFGADAYYKDKKDAAWQAARKALAK